MNKKYNTNLSPKIDSIFQKISILLRNHDTTRYIVKLFGLFIILITILTIFYLIFKPLIYTYEERIEKSYVREIFSNKDSNLKIITTRVKNSSGLKSDTFKVFDSEIFVGYAFEEIIKGTNDNITFIVGIFNDNSLAGIRVTEHKETLRLIWQLNDENYLKHFSSDHINKQERKKIIHYKDLPNNIKNYKDIFGVENISGADKTSMAIIEAIKSAYRKIL